MLSAVVLMSVRYDRNVSFLAENKTAHAIVGSVGKILLDATLGCK